jgi:hypothetical protein
MTNGWQPKKAAGLWCVGGIGSDNWRLGRNQSETVVEVPGRMQILKDAGLDGYSGHVGADYEFNLDDKDAVNDYGKVKEAGDKLGLVCVDIVGSEFKTEKVRYGSFTSEDSDVRKYALDNMKRAGDLARQWGVKKVRMWFGSDGKRGPFHKSTYDNIARIEEGMLGFNESYPELEVQIEGKSGEPMDFQVIGGTANGISLCQSLNMQTGVKYDAKSGRFVKPWAKIGPEINHIIMNGEDPEENVAQAIKYGIMGDLHACDGLFRVARDFDQPVGKWNPVLCFELFHAMNKGYKDGLYDSEWIILDQNASMVPQGREQVDHLLLSADFINASLATANDEEFMRKVQQLKLDKRYTALDRLVMGQVGGVMVNAADSHPVEL